MESQSVESFFQQCSPCNVKYVTGPAKTGHICTNYTCSENGTFLDLHLRYSYSVNFPCICIDL